MFVSELDRPWLDTPFLLQGFRIDSDEQLAELQRLCQFVYVDASRSIGAAYEAPRPLRSEPRKSSAANSVHVSIERAPAPVRPNEVKRSLLDDAKTILKETFRSDNRPKTLRADEAPLVTQASYPTQERPALTDNHFKRPLEKNLSLLSRPPREAGPLIYYRKTKAGGFLKQLLSAFTDITATPPLPARTVSLSYRDIDLVSYEDVVPVEREIERAKKINARAAEIMADIARDIRKEKVLDMGKVNDAIGEIVESIVRNPNALMWLAQLKHRDNYAYGHAINVSVYMIAFGRHLGFPREQLNHLGISGLLQDIGKIKLPEALLKKPGMLAKEEFAHLRQHVAYSLEILHATPDIPAAVFDTVATHHERYDGSGYPRGLKGLEIGMFGAMAGIVDCFQALISERPYAGPISAHQAMQDLYGWRDKYFSGTLIEQFIQCLGIFPVGSLVELNTGDVAIVVSQNKVRKLKPQVLLILDPDKKRYSSPSVLDLLNVPLAYADKQFEIQRALPPGAYGIDAKEFYL